MHPFCEELKDCVPEILHDDIAGNAVRIGLDEILASEATFEDPDEVVTRILDIVVRHPSLRPRFQRFFATGRTRGGEDPPEVAPPSLQDLFDALRLVKNAIVLARPVTDEDVAMVCLERSPANNGTVDPARNASAGGVQ